MGVPETWGKFWGIVRVFIAGISGAVRSYLLTGGRW